MIISIEIRVQALDGSQTNVLAGANELVVPAVPANGQVDPAGVWMQVGQAIQRLSADATNRSLEQVQAWSELPGQ